jgi:hypothetical protein
MDETACVRAKLLHALSKIPGQHESNADLTRDLRKALCDFASETPDYLHCVKRIDVGLVDVSAALKIEGRTVL